MPSDMVSHLRRPDYWITTT